MPRAAFVNIVNVVSRRARSLLAFTASALALGSIAACSDPTATPPAPDAGATPEQAIRKQLGIPPGAKRVIVFAQTAHLDIDWQKTFDDYYKTWVGDVFLKAHTLLDSDPRAFYSVAEMAFLEHHLDVHLEERPALEAAAKRGALRVVGGGITSPDTLLPDTEVLLRDYLHGDAFAESIGAHPHAAWMPDSFGHAATVPDILSAVGFDSVAFARIDGGATFAEIIGNPHFPPKPGSHAEALQKLGSDNFFWRGPGGGKVLAHYIVSPHLYCAGDYIDYSNATLQNAGEDPGGTFKGDDPAFTDKKIDDYISSLEPYAKTPYMFVPVGCDFAPPKMKLLSYLDGYNQRRFPETGVWAVAAPFDDYATLVSGYPLPEISGELSPYFMGYYGSRADIKRRVREAARPLYAAEVLAVVNGSDATAIGPAFKLLARTDHHDFIPGTSTDAVVANEQLPLCDQVEASGESALDSAAKALAPRLPAAPGALARAIAVNASSAPQTEVVELSLPPSVNTPALHAAAGGKALPTEVLTNVPPISVRVALDHLAPFGYRAIDFLPGAPAIPTSETKLDLLDDANQPAPAATATKVVLSNAHVRAEWRKTTGFALTSVTIDGVEALAGPSFRLNDYADQGGLWRLGNEMEGCTFKAAAPVVAADTIEVIDSSPLTVRVAFHSPTAVREASLSAGSTGLSLALTTGAGMAQTRTASFSIAAAGAPLETSSAGGFVAHEGDTIFSPTFWPAVSWVKAGGFAILLRQSTGAHMGQGGAIELMAARDARVEGCDILGGTGSDPGQHRIEWRIERVDSPAAAERAAQAFNRPPAIAVLAPPPAGAGDLPTEMSLAQIDASGIISAIKPADRGGGVILRTLLFSGPSTVNLSTFLAGRARTRTDAIERDIAPIDSSGAALTLNPAELGAIATIRLR